SKKGNLLPKATVPFDQYGSFSYDYKIPSNAPIGNYTIVAMLPFGSYNAYFNVVNELPPKVIPIINETNTITGTNQTSSNTSSISNTTHSTSPPVNIPYTIGPTQKPSKSANMFVKKTGQLSESVVGVNLNSTLVGNATYYPKELDGLLRVNPSDVNSVSIKVSSQDGTCVIGQDQGCKITTSTVRSGLYQAVTIDG
ncbi:hypothetical protein, partial [Candidatus Nitrosotalea sp. FS]|uniref:hypothetical protein n=1 Tax=Candidatus Nitrosotalea sp. FS TaxID=2341021 RepID=UPI00140A5C9D